MPIIQSFGALRSMSDNPPAWGPNGSGNSVNLYGLARAYDEIYRTQPNVRICVDFLARNIAQLGLPVYRRVSDTDRVRLAGHDLATWLSKPNPGTTRYRLIEDLVTDLGIYFRGYWVKVRYQTPDGRNAIGLVRVPPDEMTVVGGLLPSAFIWAANGRERTFEPSEIVHFAGYQRGISPLETLRRVLAEEYAAGDYRESLWSSAARFEGIWERAKDAPNLSPVQVQTWRDQWQEFANSAKAGQTAVGERGMTYKPVSFSSRDSEFIAGGKLRREVCAAAYHIPQPMVGILEHATFSNIKEQHKHTYQDTLGPLLESIQQEIERQLLPECEDTADVYIEFNIDAKLAGTPEERAQSLQLAVGRPWRTVNEARALENLPRIDEPDLDTVAPQQGGPSDATAKPSRTLDATDAAAVNVIDAAHRRQTARLNKLAPADRVAAFTERHARWDRELAADLTPIVGAERAVVMAHAANLETLAHLTADEDDNA